MLQLTATPDTRATKILLSYGKLRDPDARALVELSWAEHHWRGAVDPALPALYVERDLIKMLLGVAAGVSGLEEDSTVAPLVDYKEADVEERGSQRAAHYQKLAADLTDQIAAVELRAAGTRGAVGQLTTTAPITMPDTTPLPATPDPNERAYRGDPLRRTGWGP